MVGRESVVDMATSYGLDGPKIDAKCGRHFLRSSGPDLGPSQPFVQWVPTRAISKEMHRTQYLQNRTPHVR